MGFNSAFKGLIVLSHNPTGIRPHKTGHHILINLLCVVYKLSILLLLLLLLVVLKYN